MKQADIKEATPMPKNPPRAERERHRSDVARLREALIQARAAICKFAEHQCDSLSWENSNMQANCGDVLCSWRGLCDAKTAINNALAATETKGEQT